MEEDSVGVAAMLADLVLEVGTAFVLFAMAWWRQSAFGFLYAIAAWSYIFCCSSVRGKAQSYLRFRHKRFASARDRQLATRKAYNFERRKASLEAKIWRCVTVLAWLDLTLQSAMQLVLKIGGRAMTGRALQILGALGFEEITAWTQVLAVYGAIVVLMPLAYGRYYVARQRENVNNPAAPPLSLGQCQLAHAAAEVSFVASSIITALLWPSVFGLAYLAAAATYFAGKFQHKWSQSFRISWRSNFWCFLCAGLCGVHFFLLYFVQIKCSGSGPDAGGRESCFLEDFGPIWIRTLGLFTLFPVSVPGQEGASGPPFFRFGETAAVSLQLLLSVYIVCPVSWSLRREAHSPRQERTASWAGSESFRDETKSFDWADLDGALSQPLMESTREEEQSGEGNERDFWDFGLEIKFSETFLNFWMYLVNICACCLIILSPSLLANLLLLYALVNIFLIQQDRLHVQWMSFQGQCFCALVLTASYVGNVFVCSERGFLAFLGLVCVQSKPKQALIVTFELALILLYSTFGYVASHSTRDLSSSQAPPTPNQGLVLAKPVLSARSRLAAEVIFGLSLFWFGLLLCAYILDSLWISVHRINVMSFLFSLQLWGYLVSLKSHRWLVICQSAAMFYLVTLTACDNAMVLFVFKGKAAGVLTCLGFLSSNSATDVLPIVSLILFNLLLQHALEWYGHIRADARVFTLFVWRGVVNALYWVSKVASPALIFVLVVSAVYKPRGVPKFDLLSLTYLVLCTAFAYNYQRENGKVWKSYLWLATKCLAFVDYTLQVISFSRAFGFAIFGKELSAFLIQSVGCADPNSNWTRFSYYLARPLGVVVVLKMQTFSAHFLTKHAFDDPEIMDLMQGAKDCPCILFCQRLVVRHGPKLVAVGAMAAATTTGGVSGLALLVIVFLCGIAPRSKIKYACAHALQGLLTAILFAHYSLQIEAVATHIKGHEAGLDWFGLKGGSEQSRVTCLVVAAAILACHLEILSRKWERRIFFQLRTQSDTVNQCPLFLLEGVVSLSEELKENLNQTQVGPSTSPQMDDSRLQKQSSDGALDTISLYKSSNAKHRPAILPQYCRSYTAPRLNEWGRGTPSSCPSKLESFDVLEQELSLRGSPTIDDGDDCVHCEDKDASQAMADSPSQTKWGEHAANLRQQHQWACLVSYLQSLLEYFGHKELKLVLLVTLMSSAALCANIFSIVFLCQAAIILLAPEQSLRDRCLLTSFFLINAAALFYSTAARLVLDCPWIGGSGSGEGLHLSCGPKDRLNLWFGLCTNAGIAWSCFFCAWVAKDFQRAQKLRDSASFNARKNQVKANLLFQMRSLFFRVEDGTERGGKSRLENFLRFLLFHSLDFCLALIALISFINIDVFHLGYFGLAGIYMRCRGHFWQGEYKHLWWIIVIYNFCVISAIVFYQAPWDVILHKGMTASVEECSAQHVLGVYLITSFWDQAFEIKSSDGGLVFDLLIFVVVHLQWGLLHTEAFHALAAAIQREKKAEVYDIEERNRQWKEEQISAALSARSHLRSRKQRVERLKRGLINSKHGSVDIKLGTDAEYSEKVLRQTKASQTPEGKENPVEGKDESTAPVLERESMEHLNPFAFDFTDISGNISSLSQGLNNASATGQRMLRHQVTSFLRMAVERIEEVHARRRDTDSYLVYSLLMVTFIYEYSLASLAFPLILFTYALVSPQTKSRKFWHVLFYYVEICLFVRYCFWIPFAHACPGFETSTYDGLRESSKGFWLLLIGLQPNPFPQSLPMILLYLGIVWHHQRVLQMAAVCRGIGDQAREESEGSVRAKALDLFWNVCNFFLDMCSKSEHAPFVIYLTVRRPAGEGDKEKIVQPWHQRGLDQVSERVHHLYNTSKRSERIKQKCPELQKRLQDVSVSFLVKSVEAATTTTSGGKARAGGGPSNHDVVILEISRILLGGRRRLLKPVSDIAAMLKHASDCAWEEREEMLDKLEREEEGKSDPDETKDADGPAYSSLAAQLEIVEESASNSNKSPADIEFSIMDAEAVVGEATDYYVLTLFSDIFAFVFAMVFYQACMATRAKSLVGSFSLKSVFPADYIYCLVILFTLIVVDRAVYILNSNVLKVVYHFCTLFGFLAYLMVTFWSEEMRVSARADLKQSGLEIFLLLKSFSFFFGCRQIRFGFPTNTLGHWLMRRRSIFNQVVYTVYTNIPFLPELRMLLDWTCRPTSLEFYDWLRVEEIRHSLFQIDMRIMFRQKGIGLKQPWYTKVFQGFLGFLALSLLVWGPLLLYSSDNPAIVVPALTGVSVNLTLVHATGTFPLFFGGEDIDLGTWNASEISKIFGKNFKSEQIKTAVVSPHSNNMWTVSPPMRQEIRETLLRADGGVHLQLDFSFERNFPITARKCPLTISKELTPETLEGIRSVLEGKQTRAPLTFINPRPRSGHPSQRAPNTTTSFYNLFVQLGGNLQKCEANDQYRPPLGSMLPVRCSLGMSKVSGCTNGVCEWWNLFCGSGGEGMACDGTGREDGCRWGRKAGGPMAVLVLDKTIGDSVMSSLFASRGGLIGLYVSFVLVIGRLIHSAFSSGLRQKIWVEQLPTTKRLQKIIDDLDAARAEKELAVEEELYWSLIRIYRSPAVLFDLTAKKSL